MTGRLDDLDLAAVLAGATALAAPSRAEGFGLPVLEAMAAGVPVVCSDAPALVELAAGAALVVPRDDEAALADALGQVLGDDAAAAGLAAAGRVRASEFSWAVAADAVWQLHTRASRRSSDPTVPSGGRSGGAATRPQWRRQPPADGPAHQLGLRPGAAFPVLQHIRLALQRRQPARLIGDHQLRGGQYSLLAPSGYIGPEGFGAAPGDYVMLAARVRGIHALARLTRPRVLITGRRRCRIPPSRIPTPSPPAPSTRPRIKLAARVQAATRLGTGLSLTLTSRGYELLALRPRRPARERRRPDRRRDPAARRRRAGHRARPRRSRGGGSSPPPRATSRSCAASTRARPPPPRGPLTSVAAVRGLSSGPPHEGCRSRCAAAITYLDRAWTGPVRPGRLGRHLRLLLAADAPDAARARRATTSRSSARPGPGDFAPVIVATTLRVRGQGRASGRPRRRGSSSSSPAVSTASSSRSPASSARRRPTRTGTSSSISRSASRGSRWSCPCRRARRCPPGSPSTARCG